MKIALDIGHRGKPSRPNDRGTAGEMERVFPYWLALDSALRSLGCEVMGPLDGEYGARIRQAGEWGARLFLQLHADAGGGRRSTLYFDHRSKGGESLAQEILDTAWVPPLEDVGWWSMEKREARPDSDGLPGNEGERPFAVLGPVFPVRGMVGLLWEVGFADGPARHREIVVSEREAICEGVARGIRWGFP